MYSQRKFESQEKVSGKTNMEQLLQNMSDIYSSYKKLPSTKTNKTGSKNYKGSRAQCFHKMWFNNVQNISNHSFPFIIYICISKEIIRIAF